MSSISSISSPSNQYQIYLQNLKQQQQDFGQLMESLKSGDLAGAQQACSTIIQDSSSLSQPQATQQTGATGIKADFDALGQAIQSGDTNAAKTAYAKLQQDLQSTQVHHHRHHHHGQAAGSNALTNLFQTSSSGGNTGSSDPSPGSGSINLTA